MTLFSRNCRAIQKKISRKFIKSASVSSTEGICVQTLVSSKNDNFWAILTKYSDFGHFLVIFLLKNSIFTTVRCKTGNGHRYHYISPTLGILKRYHTSPNSQYFPFQRRKRCPKSAPEIFLSIFLEGLDEKKFFQVFI